MRKLLRAIIWPAFLLFLTPAAHAWSPYVELGTSLGKLSNSGTFFNVTNGNSNFGFCGGLSFYMPVTSPKNFFHFDLGVQNRMYFVSTSANDLTRISVNLGLRLEISRFFVGGGYGPFALASTSGALAVQPRSPSSSWFAEGGLIWRVVPELQIALAVAMESGISPALTGMEYGLRFRLPLSPKESTGDASSKFDGFRYPFGFMK